MNTFTIDTDNNITAFASLAEARAAKINHAEYFGSQRELTKLVDAWPFQRGPEIWNSFAGVAPFTELKPVKRFTSRKVAVARIWEAVQTLLAHVAPREPNVAPAKRKAGKAAPKAQRRPAARAVANDPEPIARDGSKKAEVIELMRRSQGATLAEIMQRTGWQSHTVRGFVTTPRCLQLGHRLLSKKFKERPCRIKPE